jgi:hypothetical protein
MAIATVRVILLVAAPAVSALVFAPAALAAPVGFNGFYDYSTWTASTNIPGPLTMVSTIDAPNLTLTLYEPDGYAQGGPWMEGWFYFSHAVLANGEVSFDWMFNWEADTCCSGFNFIINSTFYRIANGYPGDRFNEDNGNSSGHFSAHVSAGDIITFQAFTADNCCSPAYTEITGFDAPVGAVPEPAPGLLLGAGMAGVLAWRRWRFHTA